MDPALLYGIAAGLLTFALWMAARPVWCAVAMRIREGRAANRRAEVLLRGILTSSEYTQLITVGYLDVPSSAHPGCTYRIPRDGSEVILFKGGRAVTGLCVQAVDRIPVADAVAMRKLMIEGAEAEFLLKANRIGQLPTPDRIPR